MITTRRGRAKKRRAEEEEPDDDPTDALVRTTAALKDAHKTAREAEKKRLAQETEAAALKAERDALATRCAFLESESADAQKAVQSAQAEKTSAAAASQLELEKANQARRKAEAKQQADRGSLDAALCRVAALKRDLEIAESKAQDIPEPPPAPSGSVLDALEVKPSVEKLSEDAQNALSQATAARADLAKERAVTTRLRAEIDQSKREARGAALEREKVRALEAQIKVLSEQDAEDSKVRAERDALLAERREWATRFRGLVDSDDDKNVARQALDLLKVTIDAKTRADCDAADARSQSKKHEQALKQCESRLATADAETRRLRTQLSRVDADKKAWEGERSLYIKETESLRRLAATYDNDADATLKKRVSDLESQLEAAAKALRDSKPPASEPANAAPQPSKNETEEFRIVHLVDNPAAAAAAKRAAAKKEEVQGGVDPATLHARLKERFREHLNWFRDAVYLLTGFKVDMQGLGEGHPQVRLRSMFAEREDDSLLFAWSDDGVNLLATPFADQLDERLFANLKFCNSVPAFLASVQLNLFERQTLFPGTGTAFDEKSLVKHAKGHKARSFVVLGDDAVPHSRKQHEDNTTVQRVLAIRRRLPDVRVVAQLLLERNAHRLAREDVRVVCCDAFKYAMLGRSVEVPGLALLLTTLLAEAPGAEYAQNSHIGNTPELLQPENEMLKNHKAFSSKNALVDNQQAAENLFAELKVGRSAQLASSALPHGAAGLTFSAFVKLAVQEHDVLPVAVCSHSSVCTFPGEYVLREDDRLLVLARQPSDVAAFERWVARNAWEELNENSVAEVLPVHELVRSTSAARHLSDELRDKVARLNGKERREYFEQWRAKHVVDEVPADVKDHVVFCGTLQGAPYFLKPLASDADADGRIPQVCLLTHDPSEWADEHKLEHALRSCIFYEPLADEDAQRLWIVRGDPRTAPGRADSGWPSALERCRVDTASTFVMPNVNGTVAEENLGGDGYNVQVTRNVQAHCALYGHSPKLLVQLLDPGHVIFFNPCEELLDAGEIYVDTYLQCAAVAMHSSEAAFAFANQCLAVDRLPIDAADPVLGDGQRYETCRVILVRVPPKFVGKPYSTLVQHAVDRKLLPVALSRFPESRRKPYVFAHPRGHDVVGARDCAFVLVNRLSDLTEYRAV